MRLAMVIAVLLFFGGMIMISKFRPSLDEDQQPEVELNVGDPLKNPRLIRLRAEVDSIMAGIESNSLAAGEIEALEWAISLQREVIRMRGSDIAPKTDLDKLEELLTMYDMTMGRFLVAQSTRLEEEAENLMESQQYVDAIDRLEKARNLQAELNDQYPRSGDRNPSRLHRLNNKILDWQTRPMADEADRLMSEALSDMNDGRYDQAREKMQSALDKQRALNESFRGSRLASMARLRKFEDTWNTVQVAEDAANVSRLLQAARSTLNEGRFSEALSKAAEAEGIQHKIVARFPGQAAADPEILLSISRLQDTAASLPDFQRLQELEDSVRKMLRTRNMGPFRNRVSEWIRATQSFLKTYPDSEFSAQLDSEEVTYLHENRESIPGILESIYRNLLPVEGFEGRLLYRTEVPQSLFTQITKTNPSVNVDPELPVNSVTWEETGEFLGSLSWILAHPVSLPDEELYRVAIKNVNPRDVRSIAWSSENSSRMIQPVGTSGQGPSGFHDLLGNVAEWLSRASEASNNEATAIGGSVRDSSARLGTVPMESRAVTERNRFVGFRFVVDFNN